MRRRTRGRWPLAALLLVLGGCAPKLYIGSDTVLGIAIGYNTTREAARVDIGYDRHFVTWIPQSVELTGDEDGPKEAMSVIGCTHVRIGSLNLQKFQESLATGKAAEDFSQRLKDNSSYFPCYQSQTGGS